jgi:hypothetical protein
MRERWEAERKAYDEMMMAKWEAEQEKRKADFKKIMVKCKAGREKRKAERKADREEVAERLGTIHNKADANQMRLKPKTEHQGKTDAWIADMKDG